MKKHQKTISICAGILIILGLIFYWFFYRPSNIVKNCSFEAKEKREEIQKEESTVLEKKGWPKVTAEHIREVVSEWTGMKKNG